MFKVADPFKCETRVAQIISEQARNGVNFNRNRAGFSVQVLSERIIALDRQAVPQMPRMMVKGNEFKKPFLKSGKYSKYVQQYVDEHGEMDISAPFTRVYYTDFDMGKTAKVKDWLLLHGWKPEEFNLKESNPEHVDDYLEALRESPDRVFREAILGIPKLRKRLGRTLRKSHVRDHLLQQRKWPTSPKIPKEDDQFNWEMRDVDSDVGKLVQQRLVWSHRRSLIKGLISKVRPDGKLSAQANPCATPTFRANYKIVVNIPAGRSPFGKEIRSMFLPDNKDHVFLGSDASGLELRMLAHYMNDPEYIDQILNGDIHTYNQELAGLSTRDQAKTMIYGLMYGGGDAKIGEIVGGNKKDGAEIRHKFMSGLPKYAELMDRVTSEAASGSLKGIDGRRILMRRNYQGDVMLHKSLNTLLQSAGAIVMKYSMIFLDDWVKAENLNAHQVLWQHDEVQWSCNKDDVERLSFFTNNYVKAAGDYLNMNIPLESETMIGRSWFECH
jgi:hypothetical protein